jgi:hypothetical protein
MLKFLIEMSEDPLALERFRANPERVLSEWALSEMEKDAIRTRDADRIGALFSQASRSAV